MIRIKPTFKASIAFGLILFLSSCASYNDKIGTYYKQVRAGNYADAGKELDKNSLLQKPRNKLLFLMERGKMSHLNGEYEASNNYFNEADGLLEKGNGGLGDALVGTLVNPMTQNYKGEDFEKFMIHYYKALNYLYLHQPDEAVVEARRITLQGQEQDDKFNNKDNRYSKDAFSLTLQGLIYESTGDVNNAFIAYRNAVEVYQGAKDQNWYGTTMPQILKEDVMRMAAKNGFKSELSKFEEQFKKTYVAKTQNSGGELIFFWENGVVPVKQQEEFFFSLIKGSNGSLVFTNGGNVFIPYQGAGDIGLNGLSSLRATYPKYVAQPAYYSTATLSTTFDTVSFEKTEDINTLAFKTLDQRFIKEMSKTLTRLAVKKSAEYMLKKSSKGSGKNGKDNTILEGLGFGLQLYSLLSEKADTRNWQSLPSVVNYARIPLAFGENTVTLHLRNRNGTEDLKKIQVIGNGKMQFYNYASLK
ncbi:COG3014 family protein [Pedobacter sp. JCM 36344]|uniref:COG3014 family protein n=1 Tax=Pedobacter sp. JCM 36344 TaxID=3374280 RepID=UPI003977E9B4